MTNMKSTKRALVLSVVALFLCFTMLMGTTYAWFTDSVTSTGNKIVAGTLDVKLLMHNGTEYVDISTAAEPVIASAIFGEGTSANKNTAATLWEPGKTQTVYLAIENAGSLDLKYQVALEVKNVEKKLNEVVSYAITPDAKPDSQPVNGWVGNGTYVGATINPVATAQNVGLGAGDTHYFALSVHMDEEAGNEYQEGSIEFDIKVLASQLASEEDSFGKNYDEKATYGEGAFVIKAETITGSTPNAEGIVELTNDDGTFAVKATLGAAASEVAATIAPANATDAAFRITADAAATGETLSIASYDINVTGYDANTTVTFDLFVGKNLNITAVLHNGVAINTYSYSPTTGFATITTDSFSPFEVIFSYANDVPLAKVTKEDITKVSAVLGMDGSTSNAKDFDLGVAYKFATTETYEQALENKYANYHADFVVSANNDVAANAVALLGYYGAYCDVVKDGKWVALQSDDVIKANQEIRLLEVLFGKEKDPETGKVNPAVNYAELCQLIPEFFCGVSALDESVKGTTITVELRIYETLPADEAFEKFNDHSTNYETGTYYTVCTYTYTF